MAAIWSMEPGSLESPEFDGDPFFASGIYLRVHSIEEYILSLGVNASSCSRYHMLGNSDFRPWTLDLGAGQQEALVRNPLQ
jgi:hypothetical protein